MKKIIKTEVIENYLKDNKLSKTKFCKMCKISLSTFHKAMSNNLNFGIVAMFKMARVMRVELKELFVKN